MSTALRPPSGRVTIAFTRIEGAAACWERCLGPTRQAVAALEAATRLVLAESGGYEVKGEGGAFMLAFAEPAGALRFALGLQLALAALDWPQALLEQPEAAPRGSLRGLRVAVGVHLGEPTLRQDPVSGRADYYGPAVNRAARVAGCAHGGQVLVTGEVLRSLEPELEGLGGPVIRDLGEHRLKGLAGAERLFEALPSSLADRSFPAPASSDAPRTNLVAGAGAFLGREASLEELTRLLEGDARLVTLVGPPGCGKSRLALEAAWSQVGRAPGGVWRCDLSSARDAEGAAAAAAEALGIPLPPRNGIVQLERALAARGRTQLLLDPAEHLRAELGGLVEGWLAAAPELRILACSREALHVGAEVVLSVGPLEVEAAARLLQARAREAGAEGLEPAAALEAARSLDGLPLALELAAALLGATGEGTEPLKALQATAGEGIARALEGSWAQLAEWERSAFAQCSLFRGGFDLEAAEAVLDLSEFPDAPWVPDAVQALHEKSLLWLSSPPERDGEPRFGLYEPVRRFAASRLSEEVAQAARARHWAHFVARSRTLSGQGHRELAALGLEIPNVRACLDYALALPGDDPARGEAALEAALALESWCTSRGTLGQLCEALTAALSAAAAPSPARARALVARGRALRALGRPREARADLDEALAIARARADRRAEGAALLEAGVLLYVEGNRAGAREELERALEAARGAGDSAAEANVLLELGRVLATGERSDEARAHWERALAAGRAAANRRAEARAAAYLAPLWLKLGDEQRAESLRAEAEGLLADLGDRVGEASFQSNLGMRGLGRGNLGAARRSLEKAKAAFEEMGDAWNAALAEGCLAMAAHEEGALDEALRRYRKASQAMLALGDASTAAAFLGGLAAAEAGLGRLAEAKDTLGRAQGHAAAAGDPGLEGALRARRAEVELAEARWGAAAGEVAALERAEALARELEARSEDERIAARALRAAMRRPPAAANRGPAVA